MLDYQKNQLNAAMRELGKSSIIEEKNQNKIVIEKSPEDNSKSIEEFTKNTIIEELEKKLMNIRSMDYRAVD